MDHFVDLICLCQFHQSSSPDSFFIAHTVGVVLSKMDSSNLNNNAPFSTSRAAPVLIPWFQRSVEESFFTLVSITLAQVFSMALANRCAHWLFRRSFSAWAHKQSSILIVNSYRSSGGSLSSVSSGTW